MSFYNTFLDLSLSYSAGVLLILMREIPPDHLTQVLQILVALATIGKLIFDAWNTTRQNKTAIRKPPKKGGTDKKRGHRRGPRGR